MPMTDLFILSPESLAAFFQVIAIDLVLAGDNAVVIGLAAAGPGAGATRARDPGRHHRRDRAAHPVRGVSPSNCWISSACCSPAASCCCGCAGRCGANCAGLRKRTPRRRCWRGRRACAAQELRAGGLADRDGRRLDVARQRAGGGGRGARSPGRAGVRARPVDRADGRRRRASSPACSTGTAGSPMAAWRSFSTSPAT